MAKKVIVYEEELPPGILQQRVTDEDFYTPEELRQIVLDAFPQRGRNPFYGLDYIVVGSPPGWESEEIFKEIKRTSTSREEMARRLIPSFVEIGREVDVDIYESQVYEDIRGGLCPFKQHITTFSLTDCGYMLDMHHLVESGDPDA
jgi:hypothetical protein